MITRSNCWGGRPIASQHCHKPTNTSRPSSSSSRKCPGWNWPMGPGRSPRETLNHSASLAGGSPGNTGPISRVQAVGGVGVACQSVRQTCSSCCTTPWGSELGPRGSWTAVGDTT
eukprot:5630215-Pyramimonas_sp.AAC.1